MKISLPEASSGLVPTGVYKADLTAVEHVPPNVDKGFKAGLRFTFVISEGEHKAKKVSRICGISNGPKAELPKLLLGIMKVMPKAGDVDLAPFMGKPYMVTMGEKRVENVSPIW